MTVATATTFSSSPQVDALYESGELMRAFGGEMLVEPRELEWAGARVAPEQGEGRDGGPAPRRRAHRNLVSGELEWYIEHADGIWRAEQEFGDDGLAVGLQRRPSRAAAEPEAAAGARAVPTAADTMIEAVVEYRHYLRTHQWRVRWRGDDGAAAGEETWERWEVLDAPEHRKVAAALRESAPRSF